MSNKMKKSEFELKVDRCRKDDSSELIDNAAWSHAIYLFKNLLEVAAEKGEDVRLVTGSLNNEFYSSLNESLTKCMNNNAHIELVVLDGNTDLEGNVFADNVKQYLNGNVITTPVGYSLDASHMLLIGKNAERFRLETDHAQTKAVASFNNGNMGKTLLSIYENIKTTLENFKVPNGAQEPAHTTQ